MWYKPNDFEVKIEFEKFNEFVYLIVEGKIRPTIKGNRNGHPDTWEPDDYGEIDVRIIVEDNNAYDFDDWLDINFDDEKQKAKARIDIEQLAFDQYEREM